MLAQIQPAPSPARPAIEPSRKLIVASNRGPFVHSFSDSGRIVRTAAAGGVGTALTAASHMAPLVWLAAPASDADRMLAIADRAVPLGEASVVRFVEVPEEAQRLSYEVFANPVLWFAQHGLTSLLERDLLGPEVWRAWEHGYRRVNQVFAAAIIRQVDEEGSDSVMLHDYHLYLASRTVKALRPAVTLQQFVHIPWPAPHAWEALPPKMVSAMCRGLLGNDSLAFQTEESVEHFLATCSIYLRDEVDVKAASGEVRRNGRTTTVWSNPISVEVRALREELESSEAARYRALLEVERASCERLIVRVDRLDPSKDIAGGFRAYERLLEGRPEWRGKVRFLAFLVPSRTSIPEYASYAREVMSLVERINRRFGTPGWQPLRVVHEHNRLQALAGLELYDVLLVNSVADGMNLVAKEGPVLNQRDGVLVLSTSAGSYAELRRGAVGVPPGDEAATSAALDLALRMPAGERRARAEELRACIERHQLADWLRLLLKDMTIRGYVRELSRAGSPG